MHQIKTGTIGRDITFSPSGARRRLGVPALLAVSLGSILGGSQVSQGAPGDVAVVITADNAYAFGYGTASSMTTYFGGIENTLNTQIFDCPVGNGPESYTIPASATAGGYLYLVTWSDDATTQGVLGRFQVETNPPNQTPPVFTGNGNWEVFATGVDFDVPSGGPPLNGPSPSINSQIALANTGAPAAGPSTSGGWVRTSGGGGGNKGVLAFGEDNNDPAPPDGDFRQVCLSAMGTEPQWMWYNNNAAADPFVASQAPFEPGEGNNHKEYLIFRLPISAVVNPNVPTVSAWGVIALLTVLPVGIAITFGRRRAVTA